LGRDLQEALDADEVHPFDHAGLNVGDREAVRKTVGRVVPDWVINAAAFNDVDGAESQPEAAFRINARGPGYLAEASADVGAAILHVSTDYVFDGRKGSPYVEDDVPSPLSVYGRSKYAGEQQVLAGNANACVIRTAWLYGRHGNNFVKAIRSAAEKGGALRVVADQRGSPTATEDLSAAIAKLIRTPGRGLFHVVNAGSCSRFEFARAIVNGQAEIIPITSADAARPAPRPVDATLISERWRLTGLPPLRPWEEALKSFLDRP